jgi:PEP-CTERM motif
MLKKIAIAAAMIIASGAFVSAHADSNTQLNSSASTTTNNSVSEGIANAGATVNISSNPAWASALPGSNWISFTDTGNPSDASFYTVPNGTAVTFTQTFNLNGTVTGATLSVLADDTTAVILNGVTIYNAALGGSYPTCSSQPIGCLINTEGAFTFSNLAPYLNDNGVNTLQFVVYQEAGSSYGLDYSGNITTAPEPASLGLLAAGLIGVALIGRKRFALEN